MPDNQLDEINTIKKEAVIETACAAGLAFLRQHRFLTERKNGKDFVVWTSSVNNHRFWKSDRFWDFSETINQAVAKRADELGFAKKHLTDDVFNEAMGRAMHAYFLEGKTREIEEEMKPLGGIFAKESQNRPT